MLITDAYRAEMVRLHTSVEPGQQYGDGSFNWAYLLYGVSVLEGCRTVLDYGCGGGSLVRALVRAGLPCQGYDPGNPKFSQHVPCRSDLVTCLDVLEHVEPECLDTVLDHLVSLARKRLFVAIAQRPASKTLSDGRNAHLIVESDDFWRAKFEDRGCIMRRTWPAIGEWVALLNAPEPVR